jgi:hypothetical protein
MAFKASNYVSCVFTVMVVWSQMLLHMDGNLWVPKSVLVVEVYQALVWLVLWLLVLYACLLASSLKAVGKIF